MTKLATAKKPTGAAAPKLATAKPSGKTATAKTAKAGKGLAKPKAETTAFKEGSIVEFVGYADKEAEQLFQPGDRLAVVKKAKVEGQTILTCIKEEDQEQYKQDPDSVTGDELAPSEVKKAEALPVDPYKFTLSEDEALTEFISEHDNDPLAAGVAAQEGVAQNMFRLGGCLALLYSEQKFREYGDYADEQDDDGNTKRGTGWDKFCQENFQMGGRKGLGMMSIYRNFNRLADTVDLDEIGGDRKIGWVKLEAMANHVTKDNVEELVAAARDNSVTDFKEIIRTSYVSEAGAGGSGSAATPKVKRVSLSVSFFQDAHQPVVEVLDAVKKQLGTDDAGTALEYIVMMFAQDHLTTTAQTKIKKARRTLLKDLKKKGVDTSAREDALKKLEAMIEENSAGEEDEAGEE